jgi:enamine deaminase RidA (YjgF/YER057c/UK114 family)
MYTNLGRLLGEQGARLHDVLTEKVFFSDVNSQFRELARIRREFYGGRVKNMPATTYLQQPPANPGRLCELQARAVVPRVREELKVSTVNIGFGLASGRLVEHGNRRDLYLRNLTGGGREEGADFSAQAEDMFRRAESCLRKQGLSLHDVVRTWIHIKDMERNYAAFNPVRTKFFREHGVKRFPASTGIQGGTFPAERRCAMDLDAIGGDSPVEIEVIHASTMNEAPSYGSAFSRGLKVTLDGHVVAYISGTASVDEHGHVLHPGDIEGQVHRMLLNLERLLGASGATENDIVSLITYLKRPEYLQTFYRVSDARSLSRDIPDTVSVADVCRPDWLCEIEALAVYPRRG